MGSLVDCAQIAQQKPPNFKIKRKSSRLINKIDNRWCDIFKMEPKKLKETKEWKIFVLIVTDNFPQINKQITSKHRSKKFREHQVE